jgi:hypothetical protein
MQRHCHRTPSPRLPLPRSLLAARCYSQMPLIANQRHRAQLVICSPACRSRTTAQTQRTSPPKPAEPTQWSGADAWQAATPIPTCSRRITFRVAARSTTDSMIEGERGERRRGREGRERLLPKQVPPRVRRSIFIEEIPPLTYCLYAHFNVRMGGFPLAASRSFLPLIGLSVLHFTQS